MLLRCPFYWPANNWTIEGKENGVVAVTAVVVSVVVVVVALVIVAVFITVVTLVGIFLLGCSYH